MKLPEDAVEQTRALMRGSFVPGGGLCGDFRISQVVPRGDAAAVLRACGIDKAVNSRRSPRQILCRTEGKQ